MMNKTCGVAVLAALTTTMPTLASAQAVVPAISTTATAATNAAAGVSAPTDHAPGVVAPAGAAPVSPPATMPPPVALISPGAVELNAKERHALVLARTWRNRRDMPHAGEDGSVRFLYGATMPTVVCAPLQVCDLSLQPGEVVNAVNVGDSVRWKITPALSGAGATQITHLVIKPVDAGLVSSLSIQTNRRTYAVKIVSTDGDFMPLIAFNYPDDAQAQWGAYSQNVAFGSPGGSGSLGGANGANLQFLCIAPASGGPSWAPRRAYTDGAKTYIEFAASLAAQAAPALVALGNDGGWFSKSTPQMVNYRIVGSRYVVDAVLDRAALISGVGSDQQEVTVTKGDCR